MATLENAIDASYEANEAAFKKKFLPQELLQSEISRDLRKIIDEKEDAAFDELEATIGQGNEASTEAHTLRMTVTAFQHVRSLVSDTLYGVSIDQKENYLERINS